MIQAAGHYRTVTQDTDVIPQAVAEAGAAGFIGIEIGPLKLFSPLQIDSGGERAALPVGFPFSGKCCVENIQNILILGVGTCGIAAVQVPKAEGTSLSGCRSILCKGDSLL